VSDLIRTTKQILSLEQRLLQIAQEELNETLRTIEADRQKISALQQEQTFTVKQIKDALSKGRTTEHRIVVCVNSGGRLKWLLLAAVSCSFASAEC